MQPCGVLTSGCSKEGTVHATGSGFIGTGVPESTPQRQSLRGGRSPGPWGAVGGDKRSGVAPRPVPCGMAGGEGQWQADGGGQGAVGGREGRGVLSPHRGEGREEERVKKPRGAWLWKTGF